MERNGLLVMEDVREDVELMEDMLMVLVGLVLMRMKVDCLLVVMSVDCV